MDSLHLTPYLPYALILLGLIFILVAFYSKPKIKQLSKTGERCEGIIFKLEYSDSNAHNKVDTITKDKITVRFVTEKKEWITEVLNTDLMVLWPGQFKEGQKVPVIYDPNNPSDFTIETKQSPATVKTIFVIAGVAFILVGVYKLLTGS